VNLGDGTPYVVRRPAGCEWAASAHALGIRVSRKIQPREVELRQVRRLNKVAERHPRYGDRRACRRSCARKGGRSTARASSVLWRLGPQGHAPAQEIRRESPQFGPRRRLEHAGGSSQPRVVP